MISSNPAHRNGLRQNWLRSASALAAATVLAASNAPAFAQSAPGMGLSQMRGHAHDVPQTMPEFRALGGGQQVLHNAAPRASAPAASTMVTTQPLPRNVTLPNAHNAMVAPPEQVTMSVNRAPSTPSVAVAPATNAAPLQATPSATPLAATSVNGISVNASAEFDSNAVAFTPSASGDRVELLGSSAIIDWRTFDPGTGAAVSFLDPGNSLFFSADVGEYTVLNRITTPGVASPVRIDGTIESNIFSSSIVGGNIWFSSEGGLIIGSEASFNIGSLLLSTSTIDPNDVVANPSAINFLGVSNPESAIVVENLASIQATASDSYIAMVAPRIEQGGQINVNGTAAFVAAEEAVLTIQNNLFDITVNVGTEDGEGIVHSGSTTGPSSTGVTDEQAMYFVAVPKNNALTMLLSGTIGYSEASSAQIVNGEIILTTGNRVEREEVIVRDPPVNGQDVQISRNIVDTTVDGGPAGNILLESLSLTSDTTAFAEDTIDVQAFTNPAFTGVGVEVGNSDDAADLALIAGNEVNLTINQVGIIDVTGSLSVATGDGVSNGGDVNFAVEFDGSISAPDGGALSVGGNLSLDARGQGLDDIDNVRNNGGQGIGSDGVAGDISISVLDGANLVVGGDFTIDASANGGRGEVRSGSAQGGNVSLVVDQGFVDVSGSLTINSFARDAGTSAGIPQRSLEGSDSTAGDVSITLASGGVDVGALVVNAYAEATGGQDDTIAQSNDASAGQFNLDISGGAHFFGRVNVDVTADAADSSDGAGGSLQGQAGRGGATVNILNSDTLVDIQDSFTIDAGTRGGAGAPVGDTVAISVIDTGFNTGAGLTIGGSLSIDADSRGGAPGPLLQAGNVLLTAENGLLIADSLGIFADAGDSFSGFGVASDLAQGGSIDIIAQNSGAMNFSGFSFISADGTGVPVGLGGASGGRGGSITVLADDGTVSFGDFLSLNANGFAISGTGGSQAGDGIGGTIDITVQGADGLLSFAELSAGTDGSFAFDGEVLDTFFAGAGSTGVGGLTRFNVLGGFLSATEVTVSSIGEGGPGGEFGIGSVNITNGLENTGPGGDGIGGQVEFNLDGGNASIGDLDVTASGVGGFGTFGSFEDGTNAGDGGNAVGGTATFNAISGDLTVTNTLTVEATGNRDIGFGPFGGNGGFGRASIGGNGGDAEGGSATFNLDGTATVNATAVVVSTQAYGGEGGDSRFDFNGNPDVSGGTGGSGTGGIALFNDTAGNLTFETLTVNASGTGGEGGESSIGFANGVAQGTGGIGGNGMGGSALISLSQDDAAPKEYSVIAQGLGGAGGQGAIAGDGGDGMGGTAQLSINDVFVVFEALTIDATASGGAPGLVEGGLISDGAAGGGATGGDATLLVSGPNADFQANSTIAIVAGATGAGGGLGSQGGQSIDPSGSGGAGGSAIGGSASLAVEDDALISIDASSFILDADSVGGAGGDGQASLGAGASGDGGAGGNATGGTAAITAATGGEVTIIQGSGPFNLSSFGQGGAGGNGGDIVQGQTAGAGGDGGIGTGGSPLISAVGGTINIADVDLVATGVGGEGGQGGLDGAGAVLGAAGVAGLGFGGTPTIEVIEGSPGIVNLGNVTIDAAGDGGGQVTISDTSTSIDGLITMGSLTIDATGAPGTSSGSLLITSDSGPVTVDGPFFADVTGDIAIEMENDGQFVVTQGANFNASGDLDATHLANTTATPTVDVGQGLSVNLGGSFTSGDGSIFNSVGEQLITAGGNIFANDLRAGPAMVLTAQGSVTLNDASVIGPQGASNFTGLIIDAGRIDFGGGVFVYDFLSNSTINGTVTSYAGIDIRAGGNALFASGSVTAADDSFIVNTGDDIIVEAGAELSAANDPITSIDPASPFSEGPNLVLIAGGEENLLSIPATPIASLVIDGTLNANDAAIVLEGDAVEGLDSSLVAGSIKADVRDAPDPGFFSLSDDDGLLTGPCLEGIVCLGDMDAQNVIEIGLDSNNDTIQLFIEQAVVEATDILIQTRNDIVMGTTGIDTQLDAANLFSAESLTGNVDLRDASIDANQILIAAAGSVLGTGTLTSSNDIGITVGDSIIVGGIDTGGELTLVDEVGSGPGFYEVPGSFIAGFFNQDGASIDLSAGGDINIGDASSPSDVFLTAGGDVTLDFSSVSGSINLDGGNVLFGSLDASDVSIFAGGSVFGDDIASSGLVTIEGALVDIFEIDAADTVEVTAFDLGVTIANTLSGGDILIDSAGDIDVDHAEADGDFIADGGGSITTGLNSIITGGDIVIDVADAADLGNSSAGGLVDVTALSIDFVTVSAGSTVNMMADESILGTTLTAGDTADLVAGSASGTGGSGGGPVTIGGVGDITLGTLTAPDANLLANGGEVTVADAVIDNLLTAEGTAITVGSSTDLAIEALANDGDIEVSAQSTLEARVADAVRGNATLESVSSDLIVNDANANDISLAAAGAVIIEGRADAGTFLDIDAGGVFDAVNGTALGEAISVISGDVALGSDSIIGSESRTFSIEFQTFGDMALGGVQNDTLPYQIDNSELGHITSGGSLRFTAFATGSGFDALITLDQFDVIAGDGSGLFDQTFGQSSALTFTSDGDIEVLGNATISGAIADTDVVFDAANLVRVDTAAGGIFVLDANGGLAGRIDVLANDFIAATDQALIDIDGLSLSEIDLRLADSDGVNRPEGVIRSDDLRITTRASDVFIQNTVPGTDFDDRRGFDVNSILIRSLSTTDQPIVINGVVGGVTGIDTIAETLIDSNPAVDSTINGCIIADPASCATGTPTPTPTPPLEPSTDGGEVETRDLIEDGLTPPEVRPEGPLLGGLIDLTPDSTFEDDPLIDDPVTGAGNEDFWQGEENSCEDEEDCAS